MSEPHANGQSLIYPQPGGGRPTGLMIGRNAELQNLRGLIGQMRGSTGSRIALVSDSGLGKTRLARHIVSEARRGGSVVVEVPFRGSRLRPYEPMADLVQVLLSIDPTLTTEAQRLSLAQGLVALGLPQLEPSFARLLRLEGSGPAPTAESRPSSTIDGPIADFDFEGTIQDVHLQIDLSDMLAMIVQAISVQGQGVVLVFEDLDEAAELSRATALRLLEDSKDFPVLVIGTMKPHPPQDIQLAFGDRTIPLRPLTQDQALELAASMMDMTWMTQELSDVVSECAGGHPLLIELLMEHLRDAGRLSIRTADRLGDLIGGEDIPSGEALIPARLRRLPEELFQTAQYAVVLGDGFRVGALSALRQDRREPELMASLEALIALGLLDRSGHSRRAVFRFSHAVIRDRLYESVSEDQRAALHARAGEYYAIQSAGRRRPRSESMIYHFARAGQVDLALMAIDEAIAEAHGQGNLEHVAALQHEALNVMGGHPRYAERRDALAELLGDTYAAREAYGQAALAYQYADLSEAGMLLLAKVALSMLAVDAAQAVTLLARITPTMPLDTPHDLRWRLEAAQAWGLSLTGRTYDAVRRTRDALATLSANPGFGSARTLVRGALGMALFYHGEEKEAQPHLESARAGYGARGDEEGVVFFTQVLVGVPHAEITRPWLALLIKPLLSVDSTLPGERAEG